MTPVRQHRKSWGLTFKSASQEATRQHARLRTKRQEKDRVGITDQVPRRGNRNALFSCRRLKRSPSMSGGAVSRGLFGGRLHAAITRRDEYVIQH